MAFHTITLVGNLGSDAKLQYNQNGQPYVRFSVATNRKQRNEAGEMVEYTTWFNVAKTGPIAETLTPYLVKGTRVAVLGKLCPDKVSGHPKVFENNKGAMDSSYEVMAQEIVLLNKPAEKPAAAHYDDEDYDEVF